MQSTIMNKSELMKFTMFGAGIACAGSLMAEELAPELSRQPIFRTEQYRVATDQEQDAFKAEVQKRMRNLKREEQMLMQETGYNGRARIAEENAGIPRHDQSLTSSSTDHAYGRGFESRQMQQDISSMGGGSDIGRSGSMPGRVGRGR